ncbi:hypothetical protein KHP62_14065 [Rhodobacteraceae bacterium NNCM2]|nr:hypothetical protein [Coraliihabitans acroporae]
MFGTHLSKAGSVLGSIRSSAMLASLAASVFVLSVAGSATANIRGLPPESSQSITVSRSDVAEVEKSTKALIDSVKESKPVVVEYADKASGVLIFPNIKSASFVLGESSSLGIFYTRDADNKWQRDEYYGAKKGEIGFGSQTNINSVVLMFMSPEAVTSFVEGGDLAVEHVDVNTGAVIAGPAGAPVAAFVTDSSGKFEGITLDNVRLEPVVIAD